MKKAAKDETPKIKEEPRYDPIQERAPDRDVTKAEQKAKEAAKLSPRQQIEQEMEANNLWISQHADDAAGIHQRRVANAELTHKLLDMDTLAREADRTAESLKA